MQPEGDLRQPADVAPTHLQAGRVQPDHGVHAVLRCGRPRLQQLPGHARRPEAHLLRAAGGRPPKPRLSSDMRFASGAATEPSHLLIAAVQVSILNLDFLALALVAVLTAILCYGTKASAGRPCAAGPSRPRPAAHIYGHHGGHPAAL